MREISLDVEGFPPAKNEALSMLGAGHGHGERARRLLKAAQRSMTESGFYLLTGPIGLEVTVYARPNQDPWDATNYLGGIADVLEDKAKRGPLVHLGDLRDVALYANDRQIREVHYRQQEGPTVRYRVRIWSLSDEPALIVTNSRETGIPRLDMTEDAQ